MKVIDLLNKIANGELETFYKFKYRNKIVTMSFLIDNYLFLEILNDKIEFIEDEIEEEKKIPEKIKAKDYDKCIHDVTHKEKEFSLDIRELQIRYNDLLDYLKSKGE